MALRLALEYIRVSVCALVVSLPPRTCSKSVLECFLRISEVVHADLGSDQLCDCVVLVLCQVLL
jgi:hypothetical protein